MGLFRIMLRMARNPDAGVTEGDDQHGYFLVAPLTKDGHLDEALWRQHKDACTVRAFRPDAPARTGRLARRGANWFFDYDKTQSDDDEPVFKLDRHKFVVGEYLTVTDEGGAPFVYRVTQVEPAG